MSNSRFTIAFYYLGIGLGIILVVAFITSQIAMPLLFSRDKSVEVPNVTDIPASSARSILTDAKLHSIVRDSVWSDDTEMGNVISQKPEAGSLIQPDGTVYLVVSMGSRFVEVPDLEGLDVQTAWIVLKNNKLRFVVTDSLASDRHPVNTVVQTDPARGERVERNSRVKLSISKGSAYQQGFYDTLDVDADYY